MFVCGFYLKELTCHMVSFDPHWNRNPGLYFYIHGTYVLHSPLGLIIFNLVKVKCNKLNTHLSVKFEIIMISSQHITYTYHVSYFIIYMHNYLFSMITYPDVLCIWEVCTHNMACIFNKTVPNTVRFRISSLWWNT